MKEPHARVNVTDAEIEAAIAAGRVYEQFAPQAVAAGYHDRAIVITFATGVELAIPGKLLQGLRNADEADVERVTLVGDDMLHWESLDVDHYIPSLLAGVFGNRRWMSEIGRRGGSVRSNAKAGARENAPQPHDVGAKHPRPSRLEPASSDR